MKTIELCYTLFVLSFNSYCIFYASYYKHKSYYLFQMLFIFNKTFNYLLNMRIIKNDKKSKGRASNVVFPNHICGDF